MATIWNSAVVEPVKDRLETPLLEEMESEVSEYSADEIGTVMVNEHSNPPLLSPAFFARWCTWKLWFYMGGSIALLAGSLVCLFAFELNDPWDSVPTYVTLVILVFVIVCLAENYPPDITLFLALCVFISLGFVDSDDALEGFSSPSVIAVGILFVVAAGLHQTGVLDYIFRSVLGTPSSTWVAQLRLLMPVALFSAFLNNTPVVAIMIPIIESWVTRLSVNKSKLLLPLSYCSMMGGMCTIIGSSTNLVAVAWARKKDPDFSMGFFDLSLVGVPTLLVGIVFILLTSKFLLPNPLEQVATKKTIPKDYVVVFKIESHSPLVDDFLEYTGILRLETVELQFILRDGERISTKVRQESPSVKLKAGDFMTFCGNAQGIRDLRRIRGLVPHTDDLNLLGAGRRHRMLVEAVLSPSSRFVGLSVGQTKFRQRYNAAIIAVRAGGQACVEDDLPDVVLHSGDTLLLEAFPFFLTANRNDGNFILVSEVADSKPPRIDKPMDKFRMIFSVLVLLAMVVVSAMEWCTLMGAATYAALLLIVSKCITIEEAWGAVKGNVLLTIASSFALGKAMENSGIAKSLADNLVQILAPRGELAVMFGVYLITALLGTVISNNATVNLVAPFAYQVAKQLDNIPDDDESEEVNFKPYLLVIMYAASASFATPISYQTNLMVYGPGNYKFSDYVKLGVPLQMVLMFVSVPLTWKLSPWLE